MSKLAFGTAALAASALVAVPARAEPTASDSRGIVLAQKTEQGKKNRQAGQPAQCNSLATYEACVTCARSRSFGSAQYDRPQQCGGKPRRSAPSSGDYN